MENINTFSDKLKLAKHQEEKLNLKAHILTNFFNYQIFITYYNNMSKYSIYIMPVYRYRDYKMSYPKDIFRYFVININRIDYIIT